MKEQKIILKELRGGTSHEFGLTHALNLLRKSKGWEVNDKNWEFKDNEICKRGSKKEVGEASKRGADKQG